MTDRYLDGIPEDSRAAKPHGFLDRAEVTDERIGQVRKLAALAADRGQSLAQMALAWALRQPAVTSVLVGASRVEQIEDSVGALGGLDFGADELAAIERAL